MTYVVDTSVVVKWVVQEQGSDAAAALIGTDIVAPDLLKAELANTMWKKARRDEISSIQAAAAFAEASSLLDYIPAAAFADRALSIALELDHPVYDCFFLALAENLDSQLITSDDKLVGRCAGTPWSGRVRSLARKGAEVG